MRSLLAITLILASLGCGGKSDSTPNPELKLPPNTTPADGSATRGVVEKTKKTR
jgi:hypothetical protein